MKYILLLALLTLSLYGEEMQKKKKVTLGFGPYMQTQPYKGVD
ncbi:MAG TPA: MipA/OmpV family protein, partial [Sulfurimonas sp.]|nr:MipA/OmpV family protein [Sulfurimonas sp.]